MLKSLSSYNRTAFDVVNIIAGLGLLLSPWYLGYAAETYAAWNAWIVGAAVTLIAVAALYTFHQVEEWTNVALGLWSVIAPWALGFSALPSRDVGACGRRPRRRRARCGQPVVHDKPTSFDSMIFNVARHAPGHFSCSPSNLRRNRGANRLAKRRSLMFRNP